MGQFSAVPSENSSSSKRSTMIFFALLLSQLLLAVSAEIGYGGSGYGSEYDGYGDIFNDTWGGYGGYGGYGNPWPDYMHCCKCKSVGYNKYYLVDFLEAEGWKKEGDATMGASIPWIWITQATFIVLQG